MASYPSDLPKPVISGYTGKQSDTFIRSPYQTGLAEQRKLYSNTAYFQTVTFVFTSAQARKFEGFVRYEISDGADWFDLELILPDGTKTRRVRLVDVYESPKTFRSKNNWEINATLEILDRPILTEDEYLALISMVVSGWTLSSETPTMGRTGCCAIYYNGKHFVAAGQSGQKNIYSSADEGVTWQKVQDMADLTVSAGAVVMDDGQAVILTPHASYITAGGGSWSRHQVSGRTTNRDSQCWGYLNGRCWMIGGYWNGYHDDVYSSADGITWQQETLVSSPGARYAASCAAFNGRLWMVGGNAQGQGPSSDIYSTADGVTWVYEGAFPGGVIQEHEMIAAGNKLWILGGYGTSQANRKNAVWSSFDGVNWTQELNGSWSPRYGHAVSSDGEKILVSFGTTNSETYNDESWISY